MTISNKVAKKQLWTKCMADKFIRKFMLANDVLYWRYAGLFRVNIQYTSKCLKHILGGEGYVVASHTPLTMANTSLTVW